MLTENDIYWITRLDEIRGLLGAACTALTMIACIVGALHAIIVLPEGKRPNKWLIALTILVLFVGAAFGVGRAFVPTTREMCAIKVIPLVANNADVQALGAEIPVLAREWLEELRPKKNEPKAEKE